MEFTTGIAAVNGTRLYYERVGSGPALVMIHGNTLDHRMWDDQFECLAKHHMVIRYDQRGCGKSPDPPTGPHAPHEDLKALLDYLCIDRTRVMGLSVGGGIAINFTIHYPQRVSALIPADSFLTGYSWPGMAPRIKEVIDAKTTDPDKARRLWLNLPWWAPALANTSVAGRLAEIIRDNSTWFFENRQQAPVNWGERPMTDRLHEITVPTLTVVGELDTPDNHAVADIICGGVSGAIKAVIPGAGHTSNMENPRVFNEVVSSFLLSLEKA